MNPYQIGHVEDDKEKVVCYINGLRSRIKEKITLVWMTSIKEAYHCSLRVEEKLIKKFDKNNGGSGHGGRSGRWSYGGQNYDQKNKNEARSSSQNQRGNNLNCSHD